MVASLVAICLPIGAFITGPLMDRFGRRRIALLTCFPIFIGWFLMYIASDVKFIYAARIVGGICGGEFVYVFKSTLSLEILPLKFCNIRKINCNQR